MKAIFEDWDPWLCVEFRDCPVEESRVALHEFITCTIGPGIDVHTDFDPKAPCWMAKIRFSGLFPTPMSAEVAQGWICTYHAKFPDVEIVFYDRAFEGERP